MRGHAHGLPRVWTSAAVWTSPGVSKTWSGDWLWSSGGARVKSGGRPYPRSDAAAPAPAWAGMVAARRDWSAYPAEEPAARSAWSADREWSAGRLAAMQECPERQLRIPGMRDERMDPFGDDSGTRGHEPSHIEPNSATSLHGLSRPQESGSGLRNGVCRVPAAE
jgi:hypothetical protein